MIEYVFDSSSFIVTGHYFPKSFPSFWRHFDEAVASGRVVSVREVLNELAVNNSRPHLEQWLKRNKHIFLTPAPKEAAMVAEIFKVDHFRQLVKKKQMLKAAAVADPFVIASACIRKACVVTEEKLKENAARIPNVCNHFSIAWINLEEFMAREKLEF